MLKIPLTVVLIENKYVNLIKPKKIIMKLFKKKVSAENLKPTNVTIVKLDKNQLETVIGGGTPIGGIVIKGGQNPTKP